MPIPSRNSQPATTQCNGWAMIQPSGVRLHGTWPSHRGRSMDNSGPTTWAHHFARYVPNVGTKTSCVFNHFPEWEEPDQQLALLTLPSLFATSSTKAVAWADAASNTNAAAVEPNTLHSSTLLKSARGQRSRGHPAEYTLCPSVSVTPLELYSWVHVPIDTHMHINAHTHT